MTNLAQDNLPFDPSILRTVAQANSLPLGPAGTLPCAGVYATVVSPGAVSAGDAVRLVASDACLSAMAGA